MCVDRRSFAQQTVTEVWSCHDTFKLSCFLLTAFQCLLNMFKHLETVYNSAQQM